MRGPLEWHTPKRVIKTERIGMPHAAPSALSATLSKVPAVTFAFWVIKIFATTLGETGGDAVSMTLDLGYAISTGIFFAIFLATVAAQVKARAYHPFLYWGVIVATTTVGTTMSDYLTRTAGLGYVGTSALIFTILMVILGVWHFTLGSVSVAHIVSPKAEMFYWLAILFSQTLGTALGDSIADTSGFGYGGGALLFGVALALVAGGYFFTKLNHTALFWAAFILTRPLGATVGDLLTKPLDKGGMNLGRISSSLILAAVMIGIILFTSRRSASKEEPTA